MDFFDYWPIYAGIFAILLIANIPLYIKSYHKTFKSKDDFIKTLDTKSQSKIGAIVRGNLIDKYGAENKINDFIAMNLIKVIGEFIVVALIVEKIIIPFIIKK